MQIVIDIDDDVYKNAKNSSETSIDERMAIKAIANGVPLPEKHGRIVDLDTVTVEEDNKRKCFWIDAPTIIKASYRVESESEK